MSDSEKESTIVQNGVSMDQEGDIASQKVVTEVTDNKGLVQAIDDIEEIVKTFEDRSDEAKEENADITDKNVKKSKEH